MRSSDTPLSRQTVSLVVPVHNEAGAIKNFLHEIFQTLGGVCDYDIVFVNDGSRDQTEREIEAAMGGEIPITLVNLSRNFGKEAALAAGLEQARGDAVIPIDVDLQDPPEVIPVMLDKWRAGAKIVNARRADRSRDTYFKKTAAGVFYRLFNLLADYPIPENVGDFRLLDRDVVDAIQTLGERSRFNKGIFSWVGFETDEVEYARPERSSGEGKWTSLKLFKLALDGIFGSTTIPLRIWTYVGTMMAVFSLVYAAFIFIDVMISGRDVPGYASTLLTILAFGGVNMIALGIIGEYIGRIYAEVRQRPLYIVRSVRTGQG